MEFLEAECETGTLIGALLALIHPELFEQQVQVLEVLAVGHTAQYNRPLMMKAFDHWATPFSYARRQADMWRRMGLEGRHLFEGKAKLPLLSPEVDGEEPIE
jgi:hypothetical protein